MKVLLDRMKVAVGAKEGLIALVWEGFRVGIVERERLEGFDDTVVKRFSAAWGDGGSDVLSC